MLKLIKRSLIYLSAFACLSLLIFLTNRFLKNSALDFAKTPLNLLRLSRREVAGIIFYHRNLIQNEKLKAEAGLLKMQLNSAQEASLENARLKNLLAFKQKAAFKVIAAKVIARSPDNWSSTVIIDKGAYNGIRPKLAIVTYSGLAGRVIETSNYTSKIMLINDASFAVSGLAQRSRQEGLVSGTLGGTLIMRYLSLDSDIKAGDIIITSGLTENYPKGLLIGNVLAMGEEFSGLSRYAIIRPTVNLSNLEEVLIIIP